MKELKEVFIKSNNMEQEKLTPEQLIQRINELQHNLTKHINVSRGMIYMVNGKAFPDMTNLKQILEDFKRTGVQLLQQAPLEDGEKAVEEIDMRIDVEYVCKTAAEIRELQDLYYTRFKIV